MAILSINPNAIAEEYRTSLVDSIQMESPEGYIELLPQEYEGYIASLALESGLRKDIFLRFFIKEDEKKALIDFDIEKLSGTIIAAWFHQDLQPNKWDLIDNTTLKRAYKTQIGIKDKISEQEKKRLSDVIDRKVNFKRISTIDETFHKRHVVQNTLESLDDNMIIAWLTQNAITPQKDIELGVRKINPNFIAFSWLQGQNDLFCYGIPTSNPIAVTYVVILVQDKKLGILFADQISTIDDVKKNISKAIMYTEGNYQSLITIKEKEHPKVKESGTVLSYVARQWSLLGKLDQARDAYKRLLHLDEELGVFGAKFSTAAALGASYMAQGNFLPAIDLLLPYVKETEASGVTPDESFVLLHETLGIAYKYLGDVDSFVKHHNKALQLALSVYGPYNENTVEIQTSLSRHMIQNKEYREAKKLLPDALVAATEVSRPLKTGILFGELMAAYAQSQSDPSQVIFFGKLSAAQILFEEHATNSTAEDDPVRMLVFNVLKTLLISEGKATEESFSDIINAPNRPEDTPYTRGKTWMKGAEVALYKRYGEVASNLNKAGQSGTEDEKQKARADFRDWMESVERVLDKK